MIRRFVGARALKMMTGGKIDRPNKMQALMRLPSLLKLSLALGKDSRVPVWQKGAALGLIALILSPIDAIGDIPVVGQFWDATMAVVVLDAFIQMAPREVVDEHIARLGLQGKFPGR